MGDVLDGVDRIAFMDKVLKMSEEEFKEYKASRDPKIAEAVDKELKRIFGEKMKSK